MVYMPAARPEDVREGGVALSQARGVAAEPEGGRATETVPLALLEVGSSTWRG